MMLDTFDTDFSSPPQWARMYRECGLQVIPALSPREDKKNWKRPALPEWRSLEHAIVPDMTFERWYGEAGAHACRQNLGMLTGSCSGGVFVIDLDTYKSSACIDWWHGLLAINNNAIDIETPRQTTGGGGKQMLFRAPAGWVSPTCRTSLGVDIRGQGGFAMLAPSLHSSGRVYAWDEGLEPWSVPIEDAPEWLVTAIDELVAEHGGSTQAQRERTAATSETNEWGKTTDGREDKMARLIWARLIELRRDAPMISRRELDEGMEDAWAVYERTTATRLPGDNAAGLEREGRGYSVFRDKWNRTCRKWDDEIAEEAMKPVGPVGSATATPPPFVDNRPIKTFDFARLYLENVEEEPDYIEPDLLGHGGFMLLAGPPKAQKSFLLQNILVSCATGTGFLGHFKVPRPLRVFYLQAEMNEKLLRRRAKAMLDLTPVQIDMLASNLIVSDRFRMVLTEGGVQTAAALINESFMGERPDLIAIDPLANVFDQENESDNTQMMRFLTQRVEAIRQIVNPMAGIIMAHHVTKKSSEEIAKDPFVTIRGGGALRGYYDAAMVMFRKVEGQPEREIHFELRGGEAPEPMTIVMENGRFIQAADRPRQDPVSGVDMEFILSEVDRRWQARDPFAIGANGRRINLEMWLVQTVHLKRHEAKQVVDKLIATEQIKSERYDTNRKLDGWRVPSWGR